MTAVKRHRNALALGAAVLVLGVLYATGVIPRLPDAKKLIEGVARALGPWTYALVGLMAFLETGAFIGFIAPGETTVLVGGVIAGQGEISLIPLIGLVWLSSVLGDTTSFFIGRRLGRDFLLRHGPRFKVTEERLEQVESFFERHGGKTILIGRFVGFVRPVAPFVAGSSGFDYRRFLPFSVIGCGLWSTLFCVLGFVFWRSFDRVASIAGRATLGLGIVVLATFGLVYAYRRLRPRAGPRLRFMADRFTPGELGLELTTTAAVAGVGLYVFALYTHAFSSGARLTPADGALLDLADRLRVAPGVDVLEIVTELGSSPVVASLLVITGATLALRRHFTELTALLAGAVLLFVAVQIAKAGVNRPRPPMPLVDTMNASFPSGHAAYSTVWVAVAVVVARTLPGLASRAVLVGGGLVVCALVGLSRIYLRVHYWSDVAAGWALGAAALGGCAAVALIVDHIRNNESEPVPRSQATT